MGLKGSDGSVSWTAFAAQRTAMAEAGQRLLVGNDGVAIAFLATAGGAGPRLAPVCPVFAGTGLYLIAAASTPKTPDLVTDGRFALHAFLGAGDEEFRVSGVAVLTESARERTQVHEAVPFEGFSPHDPVFELRLNSVLHVWWERVGQPDTRAIRERWRVGDADPG